MVRADTPTVGDNYVEATETIDHDVRARWRRAWTARTTGSLGDGGDDFYDCKECAEEDAGCGAQRGGVPEPVATAFVLGTLGLSPSVSVTTMTATAGRTTSARPGASWLWQLGKAYFAGVPRAAVRRAGGREAPPRARGARRALTKRARRLAAAFHVQGGEDDDARDDAFGLRALFAPTLAHALATQGMRVVSSGPVPLTFRASGPNGAVANAVVDSGSGRSFVSRRTADRLGMVLESARLTVRGIGGVQLATARVAHGPRMRVGGVWLDTDGLYVLEDACFDVLFGVDKLFGDGTPLVMASDGRGGVALYRPDGTGRPWAAHRDLAVAVTRARSGMLLHVFDGDHFAPSASQQEVEAETVACVARMERNDDGASRKAGEADADDGSDVPGARHGLDDQRFAHSRVGAPPPRIKTELMALLRRYRRCFSRQAVPPFAKGVEHDIVLVEGADVDKLSAPLRRFPPDKAAAIRQMVAELLAVGKLEAAQGPCAAAPVVIRKADGKFRVAVDFRALNRVTRNDAYPMPNAEDIVRRAMDFPIKSVFDAKAAYWQVPLTPQSRHLTATAFGVGMLYQWVAMPFGLRTAPATQQRFVEKVF